MAYEKAQEALASSSISDALKNDIRALLAVAKNGATKVVSAITGIWKTISVGGKSKDDLLAKIEKDFRISDYAKSMMNHKSFTTSKEAKEVSFVVKTVRDFGFSESPTLKTFIDSFRNHKDYMLCEAQDGPTLRIDYADQPKGEWIRCAMETIPDSDGRPGVFGLEHDDDGVWLRRGWYDGGGLGLDLQWVVRIRK